MLRSVFVVVATLALCVSGPAVSANSAPLGYQLLCLKTPTECKGGGAGQVTVTSAILSDIKRINSAINRHIKPVRDAGGDRWNADATATGDCEDYVLAKRKALIRAGLPASALRIAYVKTANGEGHAILVIRGHHQDLVLDNLHASILSLKRSGYRVISMSGVDPRKWN